MAAFTKSLFLHPEKNKKALVELLHSYAGTVPEIIPAFRDVINYGVLYEQKLNAFLGLMSAEYKRQKSCGENKLGGSSVENLCESAVETLVSDENPPVKKKKKKKKLEDSVSDQPNFAEVDEETMKVESIEPGGKNFMNSNEEPTKKNNNKLEKESGDDYMNKSGDSSRQTPSKLSKQERIQDGGASTQTQQTHETPDNCYNADQVGSKCIAKPELMDESILINTVTDDQVRSEPKIERTPRKRRISEYQESVSHSTPFRVIPSVQLMENPARFPDHKPPVPDPPSEQFLISTEPMKKWEISFEFDSSVTPTGMLAETGFYAALHQFGLKNVQVLQVVLSSSGSYLVSVEFYCEDFPDVFRKSNFFINGIPGKIAHSQEITDVKPSGQLNELVPQTPNSSIVGNYKRESSVVVISPNRGETPRLRDSKAEDADLPGCSSANCDTNHYGNHFSSSAERNVGVSRIGTPRPEGSSPVPCGMPRRTQHPSESINPLMNIRTPSSNMYELWRAGDELNGKIRKLLQQQGILADYPFLQNEVLKRIMSGFDIPECHLFLMWMNLEKRRLVESNVCDSNSMLFSDPVVWLTRFQNEIRAKADRHNQMNRVDRGRGIRRNVMRCRGVLNTVRNKRNDRAKKEQQKTEDKRRNRTQYRRRRRNAMS